MKEDSTRKKFLILFFTVSLFLLRPFFFGYSYTIIGLIGITISAFLLFISYKLKDSTDTQRNLKISLAILLTFLPMSILKYFLGFLVNWGDIIIVLISVFSINTIFLYKKVTLIALQILLLLFVLISLSSLITFVLSFYFDFQHLFLFEIPVRSREDFETVAIYFPFSPLYTFFDNGVTTLPRFSLFFIEAGIASGFLSALYFLCLNFIQSKYKILILLLLLIGSILSFSTSFVPAFGIGFLFNYLSKKKLTAYRIFILLLICVLGFLLFKDIPYIGFTDKSETHGASFDERIERFTIGYNALGAWIEIIFASLLLFFLIKINSQRKLFLTFFLPIFFTGLINVVFYQPLFIAFCFFNLSELNAFNQTENNYHNCIGNFPPT